MAFGWVVVAGEQYVVKADRCMNFLFIGMIRLLFPNLSFVSALAISACLTPTDPVLASAIIGGEYAIRNVPAHIRHLLG